MNVFTIPNILIFFTKAIKSKLLWKPRGGIMKKDDLELYFLVGVAAQGGRNSLQLVRTIKSFGAAEQCTFIFLI